MTKKTNLIVYMLTALIMVLSACSKIDDKTTYKKIAGTWYLINDPACKWTFDTFDYGCTNCHRPRLHINKLGNYGAMDCYYSIDNNTLRMNGDQLTAGIIILNSYLSIDEINSKRLKISGTIEVYDHGSHVPININYEFKKSN